MKRTKHAKIPYLIPIEKYNCLSESLSIENLNTACQISQTRIGNNRLIVVK